MEILQCKPLGVDLSCRFDEQQELQFHEKNYQQAMDANPTEFNAKDATAGYHIILRRSLNQNLVELCAHLPPVFIYGSFRDEDRTLFAQIPRGVDVGQQVIFFVMLWRHCEDALVIV